MTSRALLSADLLDSSGVDDPQDVAVTVVVVDLLYAARSDGSVLDVHGGELRVRGKENGGGRNG